MKEFPYVVRAIHPPLILLIGNWITFFFLGLQFPVTIKYILVIVLAIITLLLTCIALRESRRWKKTLLILSVFTLICFLFIVPWLIPLVSIAVGIFLTYVLYKDSARRYLDYQLAYQKIQSSKKDLVSMLIRHRISWCQREAVKAAFFKKGKVFHSYAKHFYYRQGFRFYHIFPLGGLTSWLKPDFWKTVGI